MTGWHPRRPRLSNRNPSRRPSGCPHEFRDISRGTRAAGSRAALHCRRDHSAGKRSAARLRTDRPRTLRRELIAKARAAGLLSPHVSPEFGGLGLTIRQGDRVRGGRLLAARPARAEHPRARRRQHAPAGGGRHARRRRSAGCGRWRRATIRSCFCMTEPAPGAGADPVACSRPRRCATATTIVINGAQMVHHRRRRRRLRDHHGASSKTAGATMFLADMDRPASCVERIDGRARRLLPRRPRRGALRRPARAGDRRARRARARASATRRCGWRRRG